MTLGVPVSMLIPVVWLFLIQADWRAQLNAGKQAYARQAYAEAVTQLSGSMAEAGDPGLTEISRLLAAGPHGMGDPADAVKGLIAQAGRCLKGDTYDGPVARV